MNLTKDLIGHEYRSDQKNGWYADFYPDGQLKEYGNYVDGICVGWSIHLGHNDGTAWVEYHDRRTFPDQARHSTFMDLTEKEEAFELWVAAQMDAIIEKAVVLNRCSFCHKRDNEVRKLITGPGVMICEQCVELCSDICSE